MKSNIFIFVITLLLSKVSFAQLSCDDVEFLGNAASSYITDQINDRIEDQRIKINKRKTLVFKYAYNLNVNQCKVKMKIRVKLKRKIRRDATGFVKLSAKVKSFNNGVICLHKTKIESINLSHTGILGEAVYKAVANKAIPNGTCIEI